MKFVKIYFLNINDTQVDYRNSFFVSDSELESLNRFKHEETKEEKTASLYLKKKYIGDYSVDSHGKPLSEKTHFNISHSKGMVALAICQESNIGLDIEKIRKFELSMADYISSLEERAYIHDEKSFFEVWTNKESLLKARGSGINNRLKEITALPINGARSYCLQQYLTKNFLYKDYVVSICVEGLEEFEVEVIEL